MRRVGSTNSVLLLSAFGPSEGAEFSIPHERSLAMSDMMKVRGGYLQEGGLKWFRVFGISRFNGLLSGRRLWMRVGASGKVIRNLWCNDDGN